MLAPAPSSAGVYQTQLARRKRNLNKNTTNHLTSTLLHPPTVLITTCLFHPDSSACTSPTSLSFCHFIPHILPHNLSQFSGTGFFCNFASYTSIRLTITKHCYSLSFHASPTCDSLDLAIVCFSLHQSAHNNTVPTTNLLQIFVETIPKYTTIAHARTALSLASKHIIPAPNQTVENLVLESTRRSLPARSGPTHRGDVSINI